MGGGSGQDAKGVCNDLFQAYCAYGASCLHWPLAECIDSLTAQCDAVGRSVARGYLEQDLAAANACRDALAAWTQTCASPGGTACNRIWTGEVSDGGACLTPWDCTGTNNSCAFGSTGACPMTCVDYGGLDMPCSSPYSCTTPLHCSLDAGRCQSPIDPGQPCNPAEQRPCGPAGSCTGSVCVLNPGEGQACTSVCQPGLFCKTDGGAHTCAPLMTDGGACASVAGCVPGLRCVLGTCRPPGGQSDPCGSTSDCQGAYYCDAGCQPRKPSGAPCRAWDECQGICDPALGRCSSNELADAGAPCGTVTTCASGQCVGLVAPDGGLSPGVCGTGSLGDVCTRGLSALVCPQGSHCTLPDGGLDQYGNAVGTCQASQTGGRCLNWQDCPLADACTGEICVTLIPLGGACLDGGTACADGARCAEVDGGLSRCVAPGKQGQPCAATTTASARCESSTVCWGGVCTPLGTPGGPCTSGCTFARCELDGGVDAGLGSTIGRCLPLSSEGGPCATNSDCKAQHCVSGVCAAPCP